MPTIGTCSSLFSFSLSLFSTSLEESFLSKLRFEILSWDEKGGKEKVLDDWLIGWLIGILVDIFYWKVESIKK